MDLIRGKHIIPSNTEEFFNVCRSLDQSFTGAMRLLGEIDGDMYQADLLIQNGKIIAASLEDLNKRTMILKEGALKEIKSKLIGIRGSLDVYEFNEMEMNETIAENMDAMFDPQTDISISSLGVKLVPMKKKETKIIEKKPQEHKFGLHFGFGRPKPESERRVFEPEKRTESIETKAMGQIPEQNTGGAGITGIASGLGGLMGSPEEMEISERKRERLEELRRRHLLAKKRITPQKKITKIREGEKVETPIDRFFGLIKKYKRIRINDNLAKKLGVSKTRMEEWAMILEEHNLVELHYPTIGEPEIRLVDDRQ